MVANGVNTIFWMGNFFHFFQPGISHHKVVAFVVSLIKHYIKATIHDLNGGF